MPRSPQPLSQNPSQVTPPITPVASPASTSATPGVPTTSAPQPPLASSPPQHQQQQQQQQQPEHAQLRAEVADLRRALADHTQLLKRCAVPGSPLSQPGDAPTVDHISDAHSDIAANSVAVNRATTVASFASIAPYLAGDELTTEALDAKVPLWQWALRPTSIGLPDDHPVIRAFDVAFVIASFTSSSFAVTMLDPLTTGLEPGQPLFDAAVTWFLIDSVFLQLWLASRFFAQVRGDSDWIVVDTLGGIRRRYVKRQLAIDLLFTLPVDLILAAFSWRVYFYAQARHLIRTFRSAFDRRRSNPLYPRRDWFSFVWLLCCFAWIVHVLATGFADLEGRTYVDALYFTVLSVTSVGYGDITARTEAGRIYCIFLMLIGVALFSIVTAFATMFLVVRDPVTSERNARRRLVAMLFKQYGVPWHVQRAVIKSFPQVEAAQLHGRDFATLIANLPADCRAAISAYAHSDVLRQSLSAVEGCPALPLDPHVLVSLAERLSVRWFSDGKAVVIAGAPVTTAYFVSQGNVAVDGQCTRGPGTTIGLRCVLLPLDAPTVPRCPARVLATTGTETLVLTRDAFASFAAEHPRVASGLSLPDDAPFVLSPDTLPADEMMAGGTARGGGPAVEMRPLMSYFTAD